MYSVDHLVSKPLLNLRSSGKNIKNPDKLTYPYNLAIGYVAQMSITDERKQMMFTNREEFDVCDYNWFVVVLIKISLKLKYGILI